MKFMTTYLLTLDAHHDKQASELRERIHRTKEPKMYVRKLHMQFIKAQAQAVAVESCRTAIPEP